MGVGAGLYVYDVVVKMFTFPIILLMSSSFKLAMLTWLC